MEPDHIRLGGKDDSEKSVGLPASYRELLRGIPKLQ